MSVLLDTWQRRGAWGPPEQVQASVCLEEKVCKAGADHVLSLNRGSDAL